MSFRYNCKLYKEQIIKVIIAGSREFNDYELLKKIIQDSGFEISTVISGACKGADKLGEKWAKENNIPIEQFKPNWNDLTHPDAVIKEGKFGPYDASAGPRRNRDQAEYADALILTNKDTDGSNSMYKEMQKLNKPIYVHSDNNYVEF